MIRRILSLLLPAAALAVLGILVSPGVASADTPVPAPVTSVYNDVTSDYVAGVQIRSNRVATGVQRERWSPPGADVGWFHNSSGSCTWLLQLVARPGVGRVWAGVGIYLGQTSGQTVNDPAYIWLPPNGTYLLKNGPRTGAASCDFR